MFRAKQKKLKGTVLFTVVAVMSLLIVFLMGTLVLASSANNRAHKSYASTQTEYTARAAIESFTAAMTGKKEIAEFVENLTEGDGVEEASVVIGDSSLGTVGYYDASGNFVENRITLECLPDSKSQYYYNVDPVNPDNSKWVKLQTVKITATAELAGEESTVVAYIRKKAKNEDVSISIKGLQTVGASELTTTQGMVTGGLGIGLTEPVALTSITNGTILETDIAYINSNLDISGSGLNINVLKPDTGVVVMGDLKMQNSSLVNLKYDMDDSFDSTAGEGYEQKNIPYLYVDGELLTSGAQCDLVKRANFSDESPYNVFCGSINVSNSPLALTSSDLYLMDSGETSYITKASGSKLTSWTSSVINKTNSQFYSEGGNIFSKGNLELAFINVAGDVRVEGDLKIGKGVTIGGNLVVKGTLTLDAGEFGQSLSVGSSGNPKGIYCDNVINNGLNIYVNGTLASSELPTLKAGYTEIDNISWPEDYSALPGYKAVPNIHYDYDVFVVSEMMPDYSGMKGKYGENVGWIGGTTLYYDKFSTYRTIPDPTTVTGYYVGVDASGAEIGTSATDDKYTFYTDTIIDPVETDKSVAASVIPAHYTEVDITGADTGVETAESKSYFDASGNRVPSASAFNYAGINALSTYTQDIYPSKMTREEITGLGDSANKIVMTIDEMYDAVGYDAASGKFDASVYPSSVPNPTVNLIAAEPAVDASGAYNACGTFKDKTFSGTVKFAPVGAIWIVLDNVTLNHGTKFVIDDSQGTVNFFIQNKLALYNSLILPKSIDDGDLTIDETDKYKINYYGAVGSTIEFNNNNTVCGSAKCPETELKASSDGGKLQNVVYNGKAVGGGNNPHWIGSALFKSVSGGNNFSLLYTGAGGGGGDDIPTELGMWNVSYFSEY